MMEGGRGRGKGREFGVRAGGEEKPVARIKDPLVGLLWWVGLKAQLCGIKGELAQGQRISALWALLSLGLPSPKPLRVN